MRQYVRFEGACVDRIWALVAVQVARDAALGAALLVRAEINATGGPIEKLPSWPAELPKGNLADSLLAAATMYRPIAEAVGTWKPVPGVPPKSWKRLYLEVAAYSLYVGTDEQARMAIALAFDGAELAEPA